MAWQSLVRRLNDIFISKEKNEVEQYILSKNPKTCADVEHWLQQWTYHNHKDYLGL